MTDNYYNQNYYLDQKPEKRSHKHKKKKHHRNSKENNVWDIWTIIPLTLAICLIILSSILIYQKINPLPFCSYDDDFKQCNPCPRDAICNRGKAHCKKGFILSGKACIADTEADLKAQRLASKIGKYIASNPNEYCNESIGIKYEEILTNFRNEDFFNDAIDRLEYTIYDIHIINNLYISYNPILGPKCCAYKFAIDNKESLILLVLSAILILALYISIKSKIRTKRLIRECGECIVEKLKEEKGKKIPVEELGPLQSDEMYKHWDKIIEEVESYEEVKIFETKHGKVWQYSP